MESSRLDTKKGDEKAGRCTKKTAGLRILRVSPYTEREKRIKKLHVTNEEDIFKKRK